MNKKFHNQRGVALILVIFIVTLASVLVVNLAYSTYLGSRVSAGAQRAIQAEYLLKSSLSLAQILVDAGNPDFSSHKDLWALFYDGQAIPTEYLGINEPNLRLSLQIRPENAKLNINSIADPVSSDSWIQVFTRFFQDPNRDFDNDITETDQSGFFPKKHFKSDELAVSIREYVDIDSDNYQNNGFEADLPNAKEAFPNRPIENLSELSAIPGFTSRRINLILPFVTVYGGAQEVNINFAAGIKEVENDVLKALMPSITDQMIQDIHAIAVSDNPFSNRSDSRINDILTPSVIQQTKFTVTNSYYHVIAQADYGTSQYFLQARLFLNTSDPNSLPEIKAVEIY
jgi:type II secretory pathway component PulK